MKTYIVTVKVRVPNKLKTSCREIKGEVEDLLGWELELGKHDGRAGGGDLIRPCAPKVAIVKD